MATEKLVTIVLPTFKRNYGGHLERSLKSILEQNYKNFELIICDDGSYDGTEDTISRLAGDDRRVKYLRSPSNCGLPAFRTASAWILGKGDFFTWCFDDCAWENNYLESLLKCFDNSTTNTDIVYGKAKMMFDDGTSGIVGKPINIEELRMGANHIPNSPLMIRRKALDKISWYDPSVILRRNCDWELWLRLLEKGYKFNFIDEVLNTEFGCTLPDSLGNTSTVFSSLIREYIAFTPRLDRLTKPRILNEDPLRLEYYTEFYGTLDDSKKAELLFLLAEHYLNIGKPELLMTLDQEAGAILRRSSSRPTLRESNLLNRFPDGSHSSLLLYLNLRERERGRLQKEIAEKQNYIDGQRKILDDRYDLILALQSQSSSTTVVKACVNAVIRKIHRLYTQFVAILQQR